MDEKFIAPMTFTGGCNKDIFNVWLERRLLPQLQRDTTIVMDNATSHKTPGNVQKSVSNRKKSNKLI